MRQEQKLVELKARIAEASKKAGMQDEIESGALIKQPLPRDVEWRDSAFSPNKTYDDVPDDVDLSTNAGVKDVFERLDLSSMTALIQQAIQYPHQATSFSNQRGRCS